MTDIRRPDPDVLLKRIVAEERQASRGRLKIFFGSSAGVGKTYAMLKAAQTQLEQGKTVLAGIVETHDRPETEALLEGLLILKPHEVRYRGMTLKELDLDAALTRKPDIILVDELAHTNAPGSRHPKRWNDVIELLDAGIDVYTTLNVQHIESLSDLVAATTGVWVKETVPDTLFDLAEDIVLVDIDEDDLIQRIREGKVYVAPGAMARAAENFFKKSNLSALRELALRRTADRVDAERGATSENVSAHPLADNLMVCITPDLSSEKLIRATKRLAIGLKAPWVAVVVERLGYKLPESKLRSLDALERMIDRLGGKLVTLRGDNVLDEIMNYARENLVTKIVVAKDSQISWRNYLKGLFVDKIVKHSGSIDVYIVTPDKESPSQTDSASTRLADFRPLDYLLALITVGGFTVPGILLPGVLTATDQALLFLTGIVMVAEQLGLGPSLFYAVMAASSFHIFFLESHKYLLFEERPYLITFVVMLVTSYTIATQATRLRAQALIAREKEKRTRDLYDVTRKLSGTRGRFPVSEIVANHISSIMAVDATIWMTNEEGLPAVVLGNLPEDTYYKDFGALQWCYDKGQTSGRGTSTLPSASGTYFPLTGSAGVIGVIGIFPKNSNIPLSLDEVSTLEAFAGLLGSALERVRAGEIMRQVMVQKESERVRESFSSALSGNMNPIPKDPTTTSSQESQKPHYSLSTAALSEISQTLNKQQVKLSKTVRRFLVAAPTDLTSMQLNRRPCSLADRVDRVLLRLKDLLSGLIIENKMSHDLPDVLVDIAMIEQALANIFEDIASTAPRHTRVGLSVLRKGRSVSLIIVQERSTHPQNVGTRLLDQYNADNKSGQNSETHVNLTVAAGISRLHGGDMTIENMADGEIVYTFKLPIA